MGTSAVLAAVSNAEDQAVEVQVQDAAIGTPRCAGHSGKRGAGYRANWLRAGRVIAQQRHAPGSEPVSSPVPDQAQTSTR